MAETTIPKTTRISRGVRLFRDKGHEITLTEGGTFKVPSCTGEGHYVVYRGEFDFCSCPDHRRAKATGEGERCKHAVAVEILVAKRRAARRRLAS